MGTFEQRSNRNLPSSESVVGQKQVLTFRYDNLNLKSLNRIKLE